MSCNHQCPDLGILSVNDEEVADHIGHISLACASTFTFFLTHNDEMRSNELIQLHPVSDLLLGSNNFKIAKEDTENGMEENQNKKIEKESLSNQLQLEY